MKQLHMHYITYYNAYYNALIQQYTLDIILNYIILYTQCVPKTRQVLAVTWPKLNVS